MLISDKIDFKIKTKKDKIRSRIGCACKQTNKIQGFCNPRITNPYPRRIR